MTALTLGRDQLAAWELLTGGWLLPLDGFASPAELAAGLPRVTLDVPADVGTSLVGQTVELREPEGVRLGTMDVAGAAPAPWAGEGTVHLHGVQAVDVPAVRYDHQDLRVTRDGAPDDVAIVIPSGRPLTSVELEGLVDRGRSRGSLALVSLVGDAPADDTAMHTLVRAHRLHADRLRAGGVDVHHIVLPAPPPVDGEVPAVTDLGSEAARSVLHAAVRAVALELDLELEFEVVEDTITVQVGGPVGLGRGAPDDLAVLDAPDRRVALPSFQRLPVEERDPVVGGSGSGTENGGGKKCLHAAESTRGR